MYYEEKIIRGVLHFRTNPNDLWEEVSSERLTEMLVEARKERMALQEKADTLSDAISNFGRG